MLTALVFILLGLVLYLFSERARSRLRCTLPGPAGLPLIGNLHQIDGDKPHKTLTEWAHQYGAVYQLKFGTKRVVVANDYRSILEVLVTRGHDYAGRPTSFRMMYQQQGTGFAFLDPSPTSHALRKLTHKHLRTVGEGMLRIEKLASLVNDSLLQKIEGLNGEAVDPKELFYHATSSMMFLLILGEHFQDTDPEFAELRAIEDSQNLGLSPGGAGELLDLFPCLRFFGNKTFKLLQHAVNIRHEFWQKFVARNRDTSDLNGNVTGGHGSVARAMLESIWQADPDEDVVLTELDVEVAVFNLQVAGSISTTLHLYCFCNILLHYPEAMRRMQQEIDRVLGRHNQVSLSDRDCLHYSRACVLELFRFATTGPLSIPHKTVVDTELQGYYVPKDTIVMTNVWHMHHDPSFWTEPWEYIPERFLDDQGCLVPPDHPNRKHLMPFSAGPRVCVGENLAHSRLFLWTTALLQNFDLEPEDPDALTPCDPRHFDIGLGIIPWPYKVKFTKRPC